jgi:hypothetical protein
MGLFHAGHQLTDKLFDNIEIFYRRRSSNVIVDERAA